MMKPLVLLALLALSHLCPAANYKEIVTFGDSLTDMGNRSVAPGKTGVKYRPTWVTQLAGPTMMNIADFKPSGMSAYYGGTNYAVGGATTEVTAAFNKDGNRDQHLTRQITGRYLNPAFNTDGVKKDALHIVRIGTNDLMAALISPQQVLTRWAGLDQVGVDVAKSVEGQIQALASAGVTHVLWGNLSDTAVIPSVVNRVTTLGGEMAPEIFASLTKASTAHNKEMDAAIIRLEKANPGLKILRLDFDSMFRLVQEDPSKYGFETVTSGANDEKHLFSADGLHPTRKGHEMLAKYAFEAISAAP